MIKDNTTKYDIIKHEITRKNKKNQTICPIISFNGTALSLVFPENLTVYYTVNGREPMNKSTLYTSPNSLKQEYDNKVLDSGQWHEIYGDSQAHTM